MSDKNYISAEANELLLASLLESSKKHRIKKIAERYGIKLTDKNTKQQMIDAALPAVEVNFGVRLKQYSADDLRIAMGCLTEKEIDPSTADQIMDSAPFYDGAVFVTAKKDRLFTAVPHELAGKLMMQCATRCFDNSRSELERAAAACAVIYGSFTARMLADAANSAFGLSVTEQEAQEYVIPAQEPCEIRPEAAGTDYYIPTRGEIEAYATYGTDAGNYYYRQIVNFVYNNTGISYDSARQLMKDIASWCATDQHFTVIFEKIEKSGLRLSTDQFNYLLSMIGELSTRTRKPSLKGHRPDEFEGIKPVVMPQIRQTAAVKPQPVRVEHKPGRNDPCPCGSGKKYKKCCGINN